MGRDSPLPNHGSRTQECLCKEGRSWAFGKGGAGGAVREGFLEEVVPGRAPGHSRHAARCARHTRAASGRPPPAPMPAGPRSPPWTPAWKGEGRRGRHRGLPGAQPSAHGLSGKASPQQLTQQRAGSPGPASSLASGVSPMGVALTQVKGTHSHTHTHRGFTHACTCTHTPAAEHRLPVSYFTIELFPGGAPGGGRKVRGSPVVQRGSHGAGVGALDQRAGQEWVWACLPREAGAPRGGLHPSPAWDQEPWRGVHARGAGWLRGRGAGPTPGLPLSQEPAAAPTGHGVISKVSHADAPPAAFRAGPRPLALVPTHACFSGSWSRAPRHVQPSGLGLITCSRATCHCPSTCLPSCQSRSRRDPSGLQPWAGSPQESLLPGSRHRGAHPPALALLKSQQDRSPRGHSTPEERG